MMAKAQKKINILSNIWKYGRKIAILQRIKQKGFKSMATPIRPIPVITGEMLFACSKLPKL